MAARGNLTLVMSSFEDAIKQLRRAHEALPDDLHEALQLQARVQQHVTKLVKEK